MTAEIDGDRGICQDALPDGTHALPRSGSLVVTRGERWSVQASVAHGDCAEVHVTNGTSGPTVLLWPFDRFAPVHREPTVRAVRLRTWAAAMMALAAGPRVGCLRASASGVTVLPYQLAPARAVAAGESRLILADEVGLGKTIQAAWIASDLLARNPDARAIIVVPAGLRDQWRAELSTRFDIDPVLADARWLRRTFADLPGDVSPWSLPAVYLTSIDFIKRPDVLRALDAEIWDLVVVDEVHGAAAPTDRHAAIGVLARRARCLVSISATPYSGDPRGFESIVQLGTAPGAAPPLMFRRSRDDVGALAGRSHRFAAVRITRAEQRLQRLIARYTAEVWREAGAGADAVRLAMTVLRKRALSSPRAALRSLERRRDLLARGGQLPTQMRLFDEEDPLDDEEPLSALAAPGLKDEGRERAWLGLLVDVAERAAGFDSKRRFLQRLLRRLHGDPAIVFTEYRDTLVHLSASFPRAALLHGGLPPHERTEVQRAFNADGGLLLATDAASEGLNLQGRCRVVVNYELPWNPARLEQRIGRVDRIGQHRTVHALTLVARDTAEDLVIARLARRLQRVAATLGEHDRLAAFLDEARTAKIVIGEAAADETDDMEAIAPVRRAAAHDPAADDERRRLEMRRATRGTTCDDDVLVSRLASCRNVPEGIVLAFCWSAATVDGAVVDTDVLFVHVRQQVQPGRVSAADARTIAADAIGRCAASCRALLEPDVRRRFEAAAAAHTDIVERLIARERALMAPPGRDLLLQPGLFDRRAVRRAERAAADAEVVGREHQRRIEALERSKPLDSRCDLAGVLIVGCDRPA